MYNVLEPKKVTLTMGLIKKHFTTKGIFQLVNYSILSLVN